MSVNKAKSTAVFKNNGGSGMNVGTPSNSPITSNLTSNMSKNGDFGSKVVATNDVTTANIFDIAQLNDITETLNTLYQEPKPGLTQSIHKTEGATSLLYTTAFRNGYYNMYNGSFLVAPGVQSDSFGNDEAARPSRAVPGELVYKTGAKVPVQDDYEAKNG